MGSDEGIRVLGRPPFFFWKRGFFPVQRGVPVLITAAQFEACCCGSTGRFDVPEANSGVGYVPAIATATFANPFSRPAFATVADVTVGTLDDDLRIITPTQDFWLYGGTSPVWSPSRPAKSTVVEVPAGGTVRLDLTNNGGRYLAAVTVDWSLR